MSRDRKRNVLLGAAGVALLAAAGATSALYPTPSREVGARRERLNSVFARVAALAPAAAAAPRGDSTWIRLPDGAAVPSLHNTLILHEEDLRHRTFRGDPPLRIWSLYGWDAPRLVHEGRWGAGEPAWIFPNMSGAVAEELEQALAISYVLVIRTSSYDAPKVDGAFFESGYVRGDGLLFSLGERRLLGRGAFEASNDPIVEYGPIVNLAENARDDLRRALEPLIPGVLPREGDAFRL